MTKERYIDMYRKYLKVYESKEELKEYMIWLGEKVFNKENELSLLSAMGVGINDCSRLKLQNEINDLQIQIKAIKIVLKENEYE